jgi:hypothetical protein
MTPEVHASIASFCDAKLIVNLLVQDLHHGHLLLRVLDQHAASSANIFDNIDDFSEARSSTTSLCEACEAEVGALTVLKHDEKLDDERDRLDLEICKRSQQTKRQNMI